MAAITDISGMRKPYKGEQEFFDVTDLVSKEPFGNFRHWFETARNTDGIMEANAMSLATATKDGKPSVRTVLLKGFDSEGFTFYTNYHSRKGRELEENPCATLLFYWDLLKKMVRIEGRAEKVSEADSTEYFHSRPRPSQLGACVSDQSNVIPSRDHLLKQKADLEKKYADESQPVAKPPHWGGYLVRPEKVEFWQGQTTRLHDRILFRRPEPGEKLDPEMTHQGENGWVFERLAP